MSKPYKYPAKGQGWRLIFVGSDEQTNLSSPLGLLSEVILRNNTKPVDNSYMFRYIRFPRPIILTDLDGDLQYKDKLKHKHLSLMQRYMMRYFKELLN